MGAKQEFGAYRSLVKEGKTVFTPREGFRGPLRVLGRATVAVTVEAIAPLVYGGVRLFVGRSPEEIRAESEKMVRIQTK